MMTLRTLHTERGDILLTEEEYHLYAALSSARTQVFTSEQLCATMNRKLRRGRGPYYTQRQLGETARSLRTKFEGVQLDLVHNIWGIGYALEVRS